MGNRLAVLGEPVPPNDFLKPNCQNHQKPLPRSNFKSLKRSLVGAIALFLADGQVDNASAIRTGSGPEVGNPRRDLPEGGNDAPQVGAPGVVANGPQVEGTVLWPIAKRGFLGGKAHVGEPRCPGELVPPRKQIFLQLTKNPRSPRPNQHDFFYLQPSSAVWLSHCLCS